MTHDNNENKYNQSAWKRIILLNLNLWISFLFEIEEGEEEEKKTD